MENFKESKFINVQQRCLEYQVLRENHHLLPNNGVDIFNNTPTNEEQT